ncbi:MAG: shikimate kinase, partial [Microvirga sp.]
MNKVSRFNTLEGDGGSDPSPPDAPSTIGCRLGRRSIVLVGLMGAGKSTVGRRLAQGLGLPFRDADH